MSGILDNPILRHFALGLEGEDEQMLGARATMRLARAFNRVKNRGEHAYRTRLYREQLDALFDENGAVTHHPGAIENGFVIDRTGNLPHLDRLLDECGQIIEERAGVFRGGGTRGYFQQLLNDSHVRRFPSLLDFATSSDLLRPIVDYLGFLPALSVSKPLGLRLNESRAEFSRRDGDWIHSQLFHRDYHDAPMVYAIVALRDITVSSGPFCFLPADVSLRASAALGYGRPGRTYRVTDDQMYSVVDPSELIEFTVPAGTVLLIDNSLCFHFGSRDAETARYMLMIAYVSVCRTDFGDILRKELPTPADDAQARTRRMKYPARETDSRLRRLILDWQEMGS